MTKPNHEHYRNGNSLAKHASEDLIARRIRQGLGLNFKAFYILAKKVMDNRYDGSTDLDKAFALLKYAFHNRVFQGSIFQAIDLKNLDDVNERLTSTGEDPVIFTRLDDTLNSRVYFLLSSEDNSIFELDPPFIAHAYSGLCCIISQETQHFVKQFGPYDEKWQSFMEDYS